MPVQQFASDFAKPHPDPFDQMPTQLSKHNFGEMPIRYNSSHSARRQRGERFYKQNKQKYAAIITFDASDSIFFYVLNTAPHEPMPIT